MCQFENEIMENWRMRDDRPNIIVELTLQFALDIISFTEKLENKGKG